MFTALTLFSLSLGLLHTAEQPLTGDIPSIIDVSSTAPRMKAALDAHDLPAIKELIEEEGFPPNTLLNKDGQTPLLSAIYRYLPNEIILYLIEKSDVDMTDAFGLSALDWLEWNQTSIKDALIRAGINQITKVKKINLVGWGGVTSRNQFITAVKSNDQTYFQKLIEPAGPYTYFGEGGNAGYLSIFSVLIDYAGYSLELFQFLLDKGADVNLPDLETGISPLMHAAARNDLKSVKWLVEHGADVNHTDRVGQSALTAAFTFAEGKYDIVSYLIKNGAQPTRAFVGAYDLNARKTPEIFDKNFDYFKLPYEVSKRDEALIKENFESVKSTLTNPVHLLHDFDKRSETVPAKDLPVAKIGTDLFYGSIGRIDKEEIKKFKDSLRAKLPTQVAIEFPFPFDTDGDVYYALLQLSQPPNPDVYNFPLFIGYPGHFEIYDMRHIGVRINTDYSNYVNSGATSVMKLYVNGLRYNGKPYLKAQALLAPQVIIKSGDTKVIANQDLLQGAKNNNLELIQKALAQGADINTKDSFGKTAFFWAVSNGNVELGQLLITKGADVSLANNAGEAPIDYLISADEACKAHRQLLDLVVPIMKQKLVGYSEPKSSTAQPEGSVQE